MPVSMVLWKIGLVRQTWLDYKFGWKGNCLSVIYWDICKAFDLILQSILILKKNYCTASVKYPLARTVLLLSSKSQKCFISGKSSLNIDYFSMAGKGPVLGMAFEHFCSGVKYKLLLIVLLMQSFQKQIEK